MSVLPPGKSDKIKFCEDHLAIFNSNAVAIGTTVAAVTDLQTKTVAARAALTAQGVAQDNAKSATNTYVLAVKAMTDAVAEIIKQVKVKAESTGDSVYSLANIPVPGTPTPMPPLGKPSDFAVELDEIGALHLSWKCTNPRGASGTVYMVWRRIGENGELTCLGGMGTKSFVDSTVPAGSASVTYQIQATRSTSIGPWASFTVKFGVSSSGATTASVSEGTPTRIAA